MSFKRNDDAESNLGRCRQRILRSYGMKCIIKELTRISDVAQTLIDLIIVSHAEKMTSAGVSHLGISDRRFVYPNLRMRKEKIPLMIKIIYHSRTFNKQKFRNDIESAPCSVCKIFNDIEDPFWAWQHLYQKMVSDHISTRQVRKRKKATPMDNQRTKERTKQTLSSFGTRQGQQR